MPDTCVQVAVTLALPENLAGGQYSWHLALPDASERLTKDPRYAIRFANKQVWDAVTGENRLVGEWPIVGSGADE